MKKYFAILLFALLALPSVTLAQPIHSFTDNATAGDFGQDVNVGDDLTVSGDDVQIHQSSGAAYTKKWVTCTTAALTSGATAACGTNLIEAGSTVYGCVCKVTTLVTGATSIDIGDGSDADKWGDNIAVTAGTTTTSASFTTGTATPINYPAAAALTLTANGLDFTAGVVKCSCLLGKMGAVSH